MPHYLSDEILHRNKEGALVSNKVVRISINKAIVIVATAILSSAGVSFWGGLRLANAIPFQIQAIEKEVDEIKADHTKFMPLDLSMEKWKTNEDNFKKVEKRLDSIESKIDTIRNLIK